MTTTPNSRGKAHRLPAMDDVLIMKAIDKRAKAHFSRSAQERAVLTRLANKPRTPSEFRLQACADMANGL